MCAVDSIWLLLVQIICYGVASCFGNSPKSLWSGWVKFLYEIQLELSSILHKLFHGVPSNLWHFTFLVAIRLPLWSICFGRPLLLDFWNVLLALISLRILEKVEKCQNTILKILLSNDFALHIVALLFSLLQIILFIIVPFLKLSWCL